MTNQTVCQLKQCLRLSVGLWTICQVNPKHSLCDWGEEWRLILEQFKNKSPFMKAHKGRNSAQKEGA